MLRYFLDYLRLGLQYGAGFAEMARGCRFATR